MIMGIPFSILNTRRLVVSTLTLALAGCAVGPDFHRPAAPADAGYMTTPLPADVGGGDAGRVQQLALDRDIPAQWWGLFHSPQLNALVEDALAHNPTIDAGKAALRQANESTRAQVGAYFPTVSAELNPTRGKTAAVLSPVTADNNQYYTLHTAQLNVGFAPDVFGLNRRTVESLDATAENQRFQLEATRLTLASNVVVAAIQEASLRAQIDATNRLIDTQRRVLDSYRKQLALGQVAEADVMAQETQLAQNEATLPPLAKQLAQQRDALAALLGRLPNADIAARFTLADLTLPDALPLSLPSKLVEQRPDVRAAEALMHSAQAQIGVAIANRLPNLQLTANLGVEGGTIAELLKSSASFWAIGATLTQPLFDAGTLKHKQRAAEAAYDQAEATYRSTVITAFQNVADTLQAISADANAQRAAQAAERVAARTLDMDRKQFELGNLTSVAVIQAEQAWLQARLTLITAQANRLSDSAALLQALGGGWWNAPSDVSRS
jgi:NodT family efflux transporter outer membrane factor (OMF) lipoprotein